MSALSTSIRFMIASGMSAAVGGQRGADDLLVVARVDVPVGVRGMRPVHLDELAPVSGRRGGHEQVRPADLLVAVRAGLHDDQLAPVVVDEQPVAVADDETLGPTRPLLGHRLRFPDALARLRPKTPELAVAA